MCFSHLRCKSIGDEGGAASGRDYSRPETLRKATSQELARRQVAITLLNMLNKTFEDPYAFFDYCKSDSGRMVVWQAFSDGKARDTPSYRAERSFAFNMSMSHTMFKRLQLIWRVP